MCFFTSFQKCSFSESNLKLGKSIVSKRSLLSFWNKGDCGQATVEGALLIPVFLMVILLLIQPSILLYDRMIMQGAAAEGCRLLVTGDFAQTSEESIKSAVHHKLAAIPQQDHFHVHEGQCSYQITLHGSESTDVVSVSITQEVKLLPIFDVGAKALGIVNDRGNFVIEAEVSYSAKNSWVLSNELGLNPDSWVHARDGT